MIRAQPLPHYRVPYKPQIPKARTVEICLFFDSQDKECQLQKEKKKFKNCRKGRRYLSSRHFLCLILTSLAYQRKTVKNATQMAPFSLETNQRGLWRAQTCKHQLEEELKQQKKSSLLQGSVNNVTQEPFVPKKENKNLWGLFWFSGSKPFSDGHWEES